MPPVLDVYVWVPSGPPVAAALGRFIDKYVAQAPGDPRLDALTRTFVTEQPDPGDQNVLAELRRDDSAGKALSMYLRAKAHHEAIITITERGDLVLGLGLDDPDNAPETMRQASELMTSLISEFHASAGIAGIELSPPQSAHEWDDALVQLREGNLNAVT